MSDAPDIRDGTMAGINGPLPPAQIDALALCAVDWRAIPFGKAPRGVSEMILRALKDRGAVETRWRDGASRQWRRSPLPSPPNEV